MVQHQFLVDTAEHNRRLFVSEVGDLYVVRMVHLMKFTYTNGRTRVIQKGE